jgi:hypothetical protein
MVWRTTPGWRNVVSISAPHRRPRRYSIAMPTHHPDACAVAAGISRGDSVIRRR